MESLDAKNQQLVRTLQDKGKMKMLVYDNTFEAFNLVKEILHETVNDLNPFLKGMDRRIRLEYRDRGKFEAEARLASDILLFSMHTNVFEFDRDHSIWKLAYVGKNPQNSYVGVINMYNFLADSFKFNRADDLGYLVGRIFINRERHYFVEGKRQMGYLCSSFGQRPLDKAALTDIIQTAMQYTLDFDLLTPPYDMVKIATVAQMNTKVENAKIQTGKRLGFKFNSDDVME
ncbi:MAG: hypothetical protein CSA07_03190 [Bacteroidia bacterium]|nr:MAG: hypothetical protein CSA07_03190 [Bacteroidia bacterium]